MWSLFKRGLYGTYHHMSGQHLQRYLAEFTGRHNVRDLDTAKQMGRLAVGLNGRRLPWKMLAGSARLPAAARLHGAETGTGSVRAEGGELCGQRSKSQRQHAPARVCNEWPGAHTERE